MWNVHTGQPEHTVRVKSQRIQPVSFSPNGYFVAIGTKESIKIVNLCSGRVERTLFGNSNYDVITAVAWSPNGFRLASQTWDGLIIWDVRSWQQTFSFPFY